MTSHDYLMLILSFSLFYATVSFGLVASGWERALHWLSMIQPTLHVSMVVLALSGLEFIK